MKRAAILLAVLVLAGGAAVGIWRIAAADRPRGADQLAAQLSCPDCQGQSVAESTSPVATSMRQAITEQLAAGRSPAEVRDWFVARYGPEVLRESGGGAHALLWLIPALVLTGSAGGAWYTVRRRRVATASGDTSRYHPQAVFLSVSAVVVGMVVAVAVVSERIEDEPLAAPAADADDPVRQQLSAAQSLEARGDYAAAAKAYQAAADAMPNPVIRLRLAFALLRAGQPSSALAVAQSVQDIQPEDPDTLLIVGLAQRALGMEDSDATLSRFVAAVPEHPAAAEVRRLLAA